MLTHIYLATTARLSRGALSPELSLCWRQNTELRTCDLLISSELRAVFGVMSSYLVVWKHCLHRLIAALRMLSCVTQSIANI